MSYGYKHFILKMLLVLSELYLNVQLKLKFFIRIQDPIKEFGAESIISFENISSIVIENCNCKLKPLDS